MGNRIDFANYIFKNEKTIQSGTWVCYSLRRYKQKGYYDSLKDINENVNLVQLMDLLRNVNHAISVVGYWILDSNYKKALVLNRASLGIICAPSVGEEQAVKFETLFAAIIYIRSDAQLKKDVSHNTIISNSFAK